MKLIACMPVRNEDWVLALSARAALMWCDAIVLYLHACTDRSYEIAIEIMREHPERVFLQANDHSEWHEMAHRQAMLNGAREMGATHIAIVDADEILTGNLLQFNGFGQGSYFCRDGLQPGQIMQLPGYNLRGGIGKYHASGIWGNRWFSVAFADQPAAEWSGDKFHSREPGGVKWQPYKPIQQHQGGFMHLWGASPRRLLAKHAAYKITEALRWPEKDRGTIDREYSQAIKGRPWVAGDSPDLWLFRDVPQEWWEPYAHLMKHLDLNAVPWHEQWVRDQVRLHGAARFAGLDLFGLA